MKRRSGIHPCTRVGGPPEARDWVRDPGRPAHKPLVAPTALVQSYVTIDSGCERPTFVGPRALIMAHVHLGHDVLVGADCEIATGAVVGGYAEIDQGAKVGINATVLPYRKIGTGATVGAGAVVTRDVEPGQTVAGNPARPLERNPTPYTDRLPFELVITG